MRVKNTIHDFKPKIISLVTGEEILHINSFKENQLKLWKRKSCLRYYSSHNFNNFNYYYCY